ncbi:MAG TPA: hypothetical protein QF564_25315 [Pirellulaceae bacterium]|jgi:hypothetical protein|nr:hypothetical protein [Pirellulaceae bacterium]
MHHQRGVLEGRCPGWKQLAQLCADKLFGIQVHRRQFSTAKRRDPKIGVRRPQHRWQLFSHHSEPLFARLKLGRQAMTRDCVTQCANQQFAVEPVLYDVVLCALLDRFDSYGVILVTRLDDDWNV